MSAMCVYVQVVVLTDSPLAEQQHIADLCHQSDIAVIVTDTRGLFGYAANTHLHLFFSEILAAVVFSPLE